METGRHSNIAYEQRLCILCNMREIEDELYFVMKCPVYDQIRRDCLPNIDFDIATADTFYSLFNSSEQQVLSLAKYVYNAFIMRENIL